MAITTKLPFFLLFLTLFVLSAIFALAFDEEYLYEEESLLNALEERGHGRDPQREHQYKQCKEQCRRQKKEERQECKQRCDDRHRHGEQQQDPQRQYQQCRQQCRELPGQQRQQQCQQDCQERYQQQDDALSNTEERRDPEEEYRQCEQQCRQQTDQPQLQCHHRCVQQYTRQQQQQEHRQCQQQCGEQPTQQQQQCRRRCQEQYGRQQPNPQRGYQTCQEECSQQPGQQQEQCQRHCEERLQERQPGLEETENPYLFRQERFRGHITSQEGNIRVLERFTKRSNLLEGIDNYRVTLTVANPNTFMVPNHWDADSVCIVLNGRGAMTLLEQDNKVTLNLQQGDIYRIKAGTTGYSVNSGNNEKLYILELTVPVNTPGEFESFFAPGSRNQESFFRTFSDEILEAAFNTGRDQLRRMFEGQNQQGPFIKASQEQIRALTHSSDHGIWPLHHGGESKSTRPYNLLNQRPTQSNRHGRLHEANPNDCRELQDLDMGIAFANITRGAMFGPFYNSKSTKIAVVVDGNGYFEMAYPHLSQQQGGRSPQRGSPSYQKVRARVSRGDVYVVPAGHPIVTVASNDQNLQVVCFEINAKNNQRQALAGNNNILRQLEREAKELSFNVPAREVDEILNQQHESWFFSGPQQRQQHGGRSV